MPLISPYDVPRRKRPRFPQKDIDALVAYVASLGGGPPVPKPQPARGRLSAGLKLFTEHCAGCHQVVAEGGVVTDARVPPLEDAVRDADRGSGTDRAVPDAELLGEGHQRRAARLDHPLRAVREESDDRGGGRSGTSGCSPRESVTWLLGACSSSRSTLAIGKRASA